MPGVPQHKEPLLNKKRRNILKVAALGGGAFLLGKVFGPSVTFFGASEELDTKTFDFKNFRVVENGKELGFFDRLGNQILILEKDANEDK